MRCRRELDFNDGFSDDCESSDTVITITDSDLSSEEDTITVMTSEERNMFSSTSDAYTDESWSREISIFKTWVNQTSRKLTMMNEISELTGKLTQEKSPGSFMLEKLLQELKTANENCHLCFDSLFDLIYILKNYCQGSIVKDSILVNQIKRILQKMLENPGFEEEISVGSHILKNYLHERYYSDSCSVLSIFRAWKVSFYYNEKLLELIKNECRYLSAFYFAILMNYLDKRLESESQNLTSVLELGMNNIETLENFLAKFDIPFSGPFKRISSKGPRIQIFISAINSADSVVNNMVPLYGVYEFRSSCLNKTPEDAQKFINTLTLAPSWLVLYPPFFHGTMSQMRQQITYL